MTSEYDDSNDEIVYRPRGLNDGTFYWEPDPIDARNTYTYRTTLSGALWSFSVELVKFSCRLLGRVLAYAVVAAIYLGAVALGFMIAALF